MSRRRTGQGGFSLMEVLIGLTLLALISVSVAQSVRTGIRFWSSADADDAAAELRQTSHLVESWVARSLSPRAFEPDTAQVFAGRPDQLTFIVDGQAGRKPAGYSRFTIAARPGAGCPGRYDLTLVWEDVSAAGQFAPSASDSRTLLSCADHVRFEYSGRRRSAEGLLLVREANWSDASALPMHVSIEAQAGPQRFAIASRLRFSD
ncbi:MAG: type II secretion system protein J [Hyphomonas sp.]